LEFLLSAHKWSVKGFYPWVPLLKFGTETGRELLGVTDWIPASVPGGVHYDLFRAGYIDHPHTDLNSLKCEWVENRWWMYRTVVPRPERTGHKVELVFEGLDYKARIFLNGSLLGVHEGMFHPAIFDVTDEVKQHESLTIDVLLEHAPDEMSQIGLTSETHTQKSRFNYKWDFSARMVNIGIWDTCKLVVHETCSLGEVYVLSDTEDGDGLIELEAEIRLHGQETLVPGKQTLQIQCVSPDGEVVYSTEEPLSGERLYIRNRLKIANPKLWYPNGYGEQPLYEIRLTLMEQGNAYETRRMTTGIRKLAYARNERSTDDALPYTFVINDTPVYVKGVNMTPLDMLYGNVSSAHYEWLVLLMKNANVNLVRVWGGGIIEKEIFYALCDRYGIMIWQEFIQSSSGIDNTPPKHPDYLNLLARSAESAVRKRRNHVSLSVWSGGNELTSEFNKPSTYEDENLAMLQQIVARLDPQRLFYPTSASGPVEFITRDKGVSHDVHGQWKYIGNPEHYELYGNSDNLFHSEFGVDGASSVKSLVKFLGPGHRLPVSMKQSEVWRHHGEWWDTLDRDETFFGTLAELEQFVQCSQWLQAEGLRYIVEANRRRKFANSGSIVWQLNEPWPNVSSTSLTEYYGEAKMAYYWVLNAYGKLHVSLNYSKLNYSANERFACDIYADGEQPGEFRIAAEALDGQGNILTKREYSGMLSGDRCLNAGAFSFILPNPCPALFVIRLRLYANGETAENMYYFSSERKLYYESALSLSGADLSIRAMNDWQCGLTGTEGRWMRSFEVTNTGGDMALHVYPEETTNAFWMVAERAYITLMPGEKRVFNVVCMRKAGGGFLEMDAPGAGAEVDLPKIAFNKFGSAIMRGEEDVCLSS